MLFILRITQNVNKTVLIPSDSNEITKAASCEISVQTASIPVTSLWCNCIADGRIAICETTVTEFSASFRRTVTVKIQRFSWLQIAFLVQRQRSECDCTDDRIESVCENISSKCIFLCTVLVHGSHEMQCMFGATQVALETTDHLQLQLHDTQPRSRVWVAPTSAACFPTSASSDRTAFTCILTYRDGEGNISSKAFPGESEASDNKITRSWWAVESIFHTTKSTEAYKTSVDTDKVRRSRGRFFLIWIVRTCTWILWTWKPCCTECLFCCWCWLHLVTTVSLLILLRERTSQMRSKSWEKTCDFLGSLGHHKKIAFGGGKDLLVGDLFASVFKYH